MADRHDNPDAARTLGNAEAAFDLMHMIVTDAIVSGLIAGDDAFDACADAVRIAETLGAGRRAATLGEFERQLGNEEDR